MVEIAFHEDTWVSERGEHIILEVSLAQLVSKMSEVLKKIASNEDNNPTRLYASNAYTSLKLLSHVIDDGSVPDIKEPGIPSFIENTLKEAIVDLVEMSKLNEWTGTHTELLAQLKRAIPLSKRKHQEWPKGANALSRRIRETEETLSVVGIRINRRKYSDRRVITIEKLY